MSRPLTKEEISRMRATLRKKENCRERAMILLGTHAGLRLMETLRLKKTEVEKPSGKIRKTLQLGKNKIALRKSVRKSLKAYLETLPRGLHLFPGRLPSKHLSKTAGWRAIKKVFKESQITGTPTEISTHSLRKTFGLRKLNTLGNLGQTAEALRVTDLRAANQYLGIRPKNSKEI